MKVSLLITCLADQLYPEVGVSVVRILRRLGCEVEFPEGQVCCGQIAYNSGYPDEARKVAREFLKAFETAPVVVCPSGSCVHMIRQYPELFKDDPALVSQARALAGKTHEFTSFLVNVLKKTDLGGELAVRATYHASCHGTRLLGVKEEPLALLKAVRGLDLAPLPRQGDCCGFGGTFSAKMSELSGAMVDAKAQAVLSTGAKVLTGMDMGCLMNIGGRLARQGAKVEILHLAQLLDRSLGGRA